MSCEAVTCKGKTRRGEKEEGGAIKTESSINHGGSRIKRKEKGLKGEQTREGKKGAEGTNWVRDECKVAFCDGLGQVAVKGGMSGLLANCRKLVVRVEAEELGSG